MSWFMQSVLFNVNAVKGCIKLLKYLLLLTSLEDFKNPP